MNKPQYLPFSGDFFKQKGIKMLAMVLLVVSGQNGLEAMCQAVGCRSSNCSPSQTSYFNTPESITRMRLNATSLARNLSSNSDMLMPAVVSGDTTHRVAAAFAAGMTHKSDEVLFTLLEDNDPLVSQAAREALTHIAVVKLNRRVDFGPYPNSDPAHKSDSANLWRIFYSRNRLPNSPSSPNNDEDQNSVSRRAPSKKTVEVKATLPTRRITVESIDDTTIPGFKIKRIETITVPDDTN